MFKDLRAYTMTILSHSPSRYCATSAIALVVFAPFAEPRWAGGWFVAGAALFYGAAGFFAWKRDRNGAEAAE